MGTSDQLVPALIAVLFGLLAWALSRAVSRVESDIKDLWHELKELNRTIQAILNRITIIETSRREDH